MKKISLDWIVLAAIIFLLPFERLLTFELAGFTVKPSYIAAIVYIAYQLYKIISGKILFRLRNSEWLMLALVFWSYLTALWSLAPVRTLIMSTLLLFMVVTFILISRNASSLKRNKISNRIIWIGLALSLFAILQFFAEPLFGYRIALLREQYGSGVFGFPRPQATFLEPLFFANFLTWPIYLLLQKIQSARNYKNFLALVTLLTAFVLTLSRGAYLGLAVGIVVVFVSLLIIKKFNLKLLSTLLLAGIAAIIIASGMVLLVSGSGGVKTFWSHAISATDLPPSNEIELLKGRDYSNQVVGTELSSHRWLGLGYGAFGALPQYQLLREHGDWQMVNNEYLEVMIEQGIVGFLVFLSLLLLLLGFIFAKIKKGQMEYSFYAGAVTALLVQYLTFSSLNLLYIWVFLGLIASHKTSKMEDLTLT